MRIDERGRASTDARLARAEMRLEKVGGRSVDVTELQGQRISGTGFVSKVWLRQAKAKRQKDC